MVDVDQREDDNSSSHGEDKELVCLVISEPDHKNIICSQPDYILNFFCLLRKSPEQS